MNVRLQRQLEETLALPGNNNCADCHSPAPRWASINLGIFLCVGCASVHRKMGTHKSRVKSVTLDTWTREQIQNMKAIGNTTSNSIYNPNESLHPPPTSTGDADDRDSEIERYIRKKYELGAFKNGGQAPVREPTSINRYKEANGTPQPPPANGRPSYPTNATWETQSDKDDKLRIARENPRNPELNDVLRLNPTSTSTPSKYNRDLPALPAPSPINSTFTASRQRPVRTGSAAGNGVNGSMTEPKLIDVEDSTSSTLPLQVNVGSYGQQAQPTWTNGLSGSYGAMSSLPQQQQQPPFQSPTQPQSSFNPFYQSTQQTQPVQPFLSPTPQFNGTSYYPNGNPAIGPISPYMLSPQNPFFQQQLPMNPQQMQQQQQPQQAYGQMQYPTQQFAPQAGYQPMQQVWNGSNGYTQGYGR